MLIIIILMIIIKRTYNKHILKRINKYIANCNYIRLVINIF